MPLLLLLGLAIPSVGALVYSTVADKSIEASQEVTRNTVPSIVTLGAAALGLYAAFKLLEKVK